MDECRTVEITISISENVYNRIMYLEPRKDSKLIGDILMCAVQEGKVLDARQD